MIKVILKSNNIFIAILRSSQTKSSKLLTGSAYDHFIRL